MSYYFNKVLSSCSFEEAIQRVSDELQKEGFAVITEVDVTKIFKEKINVDFKKYRILGACNPHFAHEALLSEDKIGLFLPCNIIVEENEKGQIEIAAVDPIASMISVKNNDLEEFGLTVREKMKKIIDNLE